MPTDYRAMLRSIGLTASEAKVYLASLEHGPSTVVDLAKHANLSRPATYEAIETLVRKGLLSSFLHGKRHRYTAESPERVLAYAEAEARRRESTIREFSDVLGDLKLLRSGDQPSLKFFEGLEGLRAIAEDLLASKPETTDEIANLDAVNQIFSADELKGIRQVLVKIKSKGRALLTGNVPGVREGIAARVLPPETFPFYGDIMIYGPKVAMITFKGKLIGVVVENQILADTMRALFELAWRGAKDYPTLSK